MESTTARMLDNGDRILIADQYTEAAGGGSGEWRAARTVKKTGALQVPGEPVGVHAATVVRVDNSATLGRLDVVTNLGTVHAVTPGQRFRPAPAGMRDSADVRAEMAAFRKQREAKQAHDAANPPDVDGVNVAPGDLVELVAIGGVRAGQPGTVVRAIRAYGVVGGLLVPRAYERAYGDNPAGTSLALTFRRIADQDATGTARRSCGCPAIIRETLIPAPADGDTAAWAAAVRDMNRMSVEDWSHATGCPWADAPGRERYAVAFVDEADDNGEHVLTVHDISGSSNGQSCRDGIRLEGHRADVSGLDTETLLWHRYPPETFPDRAALPPVRVASCLPAPRLLHAEIAQTIAAEPFYGMGGSSWGSTPLPGMVPVPPAGTLTDTPHAPQDRSRLAIEDPWAAVFAGSGQ